MNLLSLGRLTDMGQRNLDLCRDLETNREVVRKSLKDPQDPGQRAAIAREVRTLELGRDCPNIPNILASDLEGEDPFYVLEHFPHGALSDHLKPFSEADLAIVAEQLLVAIECIHSQRGAHGDIKPANILVNEAGIQLADPLGNGPGVTQTPGKKGGTPGYWAPEIRSNGDISPAGDMYSFGVTLYELMTGTQPRDGMVIDPGPYELSPGLKEIGQLVRYACRRDPDSRPTAENLLRFLREGNPLPEKPGYDWIVPLFVLGGFLLVVSLAARKS